MKSTIFWDITQCSQFKVNRRFGRTYGRRHVPPKRRLTFNALHGVTSQKLENVIPPRRQSFSWVHGVISHKIALLTNVIFLPRTACDICWKSIWTTLKIFGGNSSLHPTFLKSRSAYYLHMTEEQAWPSTVLKWRMTLLGWSMLFSNQSVNPATSSPADDVHH
jgi:hypothetical protein